MDYKIFKENGAKVVESCSKVIVGKEEEIKLIFVSFLCSGHVLLEDVPGTGKTMLLRAFAKTVGSDFKRIQFTPDLLPSDLRSTVQLRVLSPACWRRWRKRRSP